MKKRFFALVTAAVILLSIILPVSAAEYKNFTISEDTLTLSDGETTYERINLPEGYFADSHYSYQYYYPIEMPNGSNINGQLSAISKARDILSVELYLEQYGSLNILYAEKAAKTDIEKFLSGEDELFRMKSNFSKEYYAKIDKSLIERLNAYVEANPDKSETIDVSKLVQPIMTTASFTILSYSKDYVVAREYGGIYKIGDSFDGWYYVNFGDLDNSYFNVDGYFSYRKGAITMTKLDSVLGLELGTLSAAQEYMFTTYESEYQYVDEEFFNLGSYEESVAARVFFWIVFVFLGFIIPAVPMIFGLVLPNTKKRHTKKWYIVAAFSLLWILTAAVIMLILIL